MPMTVTVLRSWDMACSLSGCLWPAYRWLGREHGRTIPLPDISARLSDKIRRRGDKLIFGHGSVRSQTLDTKLRLRALAGMGLRGRSLPAATYRAQLANAPTNI